MSPTTSPPRLALVRPDASRHVPWLAMVGEFGGEHVAGGAFFADRTQALGDPDTFASWVDDVLAHERGERVREGWVPSTLRWVADGDTLVGTIHLRHELNAGLLEEGGHIGYAVRPTARRRGVASWSLAAMLDLARGRGIERCLVTCDDDNLGSIGTIEGNGGVLEDVRAGKRRYWITVGE